MQSRKPGIDNNSFNGPDDEVWSNTAALRNDEDKTIL
jgi:hypothetical protein